MAFTAGLVGVSEMRCSLRRTSLQQSPFSFMLRRSMLRLSARSGSFPVKGVVSSFLKFGSPSRKLPEIVRAGDPILSEPASPVPTAEINTPRIQHIIDDLVALMRSVPAVGISAPQIGIPLQIPLKFFAVTILLYNIAHSKRKQRFPSTIILSLADHQVFLNMHQCDLQEERDLLSHGVKLRLKQSWLASHNSSFCGEFESNCQCQFFSFCNSYRDILFSKRPCRHVDGEKLDLEITDACLLHVLNHVLKTRDLVAKTNEKTAIASGKEAPRDHGFTRPKVLILLPLRSTALRLVKRLIELTPASHKIIVLEDTKEYISYVSKEDADSQQRFPFDLLVICNPVLKKQGTQRARFFEGCLSVDGYRGLVERHLEVEVSGFGRDGLPIKMKATGWQARILQHECDHLQGMLYVEKMLPKTFRTNENLRLPLPIGCPKPGKCV